MSTTPPEFAPTARALIALGYRKRRQFLWHRVRPKLPRFLYKFRSLDPSDEQSVDRLRDILVRSRLWFSSPQDFNDPFDTSIKAVLGGGVEDLRDRLDNIYKERGMTWTQRQRELRRIMARPQDIPSRVQESLKNTLYETGVCSFGGDPRSIFMWSHYAANHEGVCIQFELARDVENLVSLEVKYREEYPVLHWVDRMEQLMPAILTKFAGWSYEQERRILVPEGARQFFGFNSAALTAIIIGCRAGTQVFTSLKSLLAERSARGHSMPKLYRIHLDDSNYELIIRSAD